MPQLKSSPIIVKKRKKTFAIIILANHKYKGLQFYTSNKADFQLATMLRPNKEFVLKHEHYKNLKKVNSISKFMFIKSGQMLVNIYESVKSKKKLSSQILNSGDCILFFHGAMTFRMKKQTKIIEIKQGPHEPSKDKIYQKKLK